MGRGSKKYKEWRSKVLERDKYKCVKCENARHLHCDHIIPWKKDETLCYDVSNGQTLCAGCHLKKGREHKEIVNDVHTRFKKGVCRFPDVNKGRIPWNKGKKLDDETKKKLSENSKGQRRSIKTEFKKGENLGNQNGFKKGQESCRKGKKHTEEAKEKCRQSNLGKRLSPTTEFKKGMIPWNKGLKKEKIWQSEE